ncbi:calcium-activated potassium channel slowpoke [Ditylenchus destructor]|nr:calcium-activated potassium channel slowpoke [Ditylenchus destructor]
MLSLFLACLAGIGSLAIYFIDISKDSFQVVNCKPLSENLTQQIDLGLNTIFLLAFLKRFVDAPDKIKLLRYDWYTMVDFATIPPSFLAVYMGKSFSGLRFAAAFRLMPLPTFLYIAHIIKMENTGDPWSDFANANPVSFLQCAYSLLMAILTFGIKHSFCKTIWGRVTLVFTAWTNIIFFVTLTIYYRSENRRQRSVVPTGNNAKGLEEGESEKLKQVKDNVDMTPDFRLIKHSF